jgi:hypothetical protein
LRSGFADELLQGRAQVAGDDTTYFGLVSSLTAQFAHGRRRLHVAGRPVALHHLVGDAAPQHRSVVVKEAGEEGVALVIGDSLLMVDGSRPG